MFIFVLIILKAAVVMILTHGRFKTSSAALTAQNSPRLEIRIGNVFQDASVLKSVAKIHFEIIPPLKSRQDFLTMTVWSMQNYCFPLKQTE